MAIPASANLDDELCTALRINASIYAEMLQLAAQGASQQDTAIELLCVTVPISGQTYPAKPRLYLIFRKFGRDQEKIEQRLHAMAESCFASLQAASYIVKREAESWETLQEALNGIQERSLISIEKNVRIGALPGQMGYLCYTNAYQQDEIHNFSRVYEAMTHYPGMALSYQLIPTNFVQSEASFVQGIIRCLDASAQPGQMTMQMSEAANTTEARRKQWINRSICAISSSRAQKRAR